MAAFLFAATAFAAVAGVWLIWPNALLDRLWELNKPGAAAVDAAESGCESQRCRYGFSGGACGPRDFSAPSTSACFSAAVSLAAGCMGR